MSMTKTARKLAIAAFEIGAIQIQPEKPFTWASGWISPIYNDNRLFLENSKYRKLIRKGFQKLMKANNIFIPEAIAGTSTAGIPHATSLADKLHLSLIYIREQPKGHGMKNRIEGIKAEKGLEDCEVILIEDLISTGGSSVSAVQAILDAGGDIDYCFSIFNYGFPKAVAMFNGTIPFNKEGGLLSSNCKVLSLLTFPELLEVGVELGHIKKDQEELLRSWSENPEKWSDDWKIAHLD